jgi:hypothetical protein
MFSSTLTLPAEAAALPIAQSFVAHLVTMAGLTGEDEDAVVGAAVEACATSSTTHEPGEHGTFTLAGDIDADARPLRATRAADRRNARGRRRQPGAE